MAAIGGLAFLQSNLSASVAQLLLPTLLFVVSSGAQVDVSGLTDAGLVGP
jgi:hypothetical protein